MADSRGGGEGDQNCVRLEKEAVASAVEEKEGGGKGNYHFRRGEVVSVPRDVAGKMDDDALYYLASIFPVPGFYTFRARCPTFDERCSTFQSTKRKEGKQHFSNVVLPTPVTQKAALREESDLSAGKISP